MKKIFELLFLLFLLALIFIYRSNIISFIMDNFIHKMEPYVSTPNNYTLYNDYDYVKITNDFVANNPQEILDIFYTYLNNGEDEFYFYCDYDECQKDISKFNYENIFVNINNFVHPYNTYKRLYIIPNSWGKVTVQVEKTYTEKEINDINVKIVEIMDKIIKKYMTIEKKIKTFHDYIINNTVYDTEYVNSGINDINSPSHKASGPLLYSKSLCGGYSHAMALFLNILKIPNYRISSDTHIWNLVYIDNNWYHLDLTWDDPVTSDKTNILLDDYFLITTNKLSELNIGRHNFDKKVYQETIQID